MKKILLVYPHNFLSKDMGTNMRVYSLAKELSACGYCLDLYACSNFCSSFEHFESLNSEGIVNNLFLYDYTKSRKKVKKRNKRTFRYKVEGKILKEVFKIERSDDELDNWVTPTMQEQFNAIVSSTDYDFIAMFYVYTAELLSPLTYTGTAKKIYFMEDFLSVGHFVSGKNKSLGQLLDSELSRINYFDTIVCISSDEKNFFEKLLWNKNFYFLPHLIGGRTIHQKKNSLKAQVLFLGHDNEYNKQGLNWFLQNVYPCLNTDVEVLIAGKVADSVPLSVYPNIKKIGFVEELENLYANTDVVICPLQNGTGMKIKVVEAMSYGIPVVCTSRGVDGFPDKSKNGCLVADDPKDFALAVNRLANDESFYLECQEKIGCYFSEMLSWNRYKDKIAEIFK